MQKIKQFIQNSNVLKNASLSMIGSILIRAVDLISIPIFTRILDTTVYGRVSVFTTYVQIFTIILSLDFRGCVGKAMLEFKDEKEKFHSAAICFSMIWTAVVIFIFNMCHGLAERLLAMNHLEMNILLIYSFGYFVVNYKSVEYIFSLEYKKNLIMNMAVAGGNLVLSVILVLSIFSDNRFLGRIVGATVPTLLIAIVIMVSYFKKGKTLWKWEHIKYALKFSVPLIPHNLSHLILSNSDRVMIQGMISNAASGVYSLTYNVGLMMHVVTEGAYNVWNPLLYRRLEENEDAIVKRHARIFLVGFTIVAIGVTGVSPEIIKIIAGRDYWGGIDLVMWVCLSTYFTFVYQLYVNVEFYCKKTAWISSGTVMAAVVNILLNLYGLPIWGYEFAAVSTVVSYAALVIFHCIVLNVVIRKKVIDNVFSLTIAAVMVAVTGSLHMVRNNLGLRFLALVIWELIFGALLLILLKRERQYTK